jgi:hypothetical protein
VTDAYRKALRYFEACGAVPIWIVEVNGVAEVHTGKFSARAVTAY